MPLCASEDGHSDRHMIALSLVHLRFCELVALVRAQVKAWVRQSPVRHGRLLKMSFPFIGPLPPPPLLPVDAVAPKRLAVSVRRPPLSWLPLGATPPLPLPLLKADSIDRAKRRRARR